LAESVKLGLEVIRALSQTAEACLLYVEGEGHDPAMVHVALHASDRAEHVAQYFLEAPDKIWPLDSVLDDVAWLLEIAPVTDRVRNKVIRAIPSRGELQELHSGIAARIAQDGPPAGYKGLWVPPVL
jgi:hypothetical protein